MVKIVKCPKCGTDDLVSTFVMKAKCPKCGTIMKEMDPITVLASKPLNTSPSQ